MKFSVLRSFRDARTFRFPLTVLFLVFSTAAGLTEEKEKTRARPTPQPTGSPKSTATPNASATPETKIDPRMEAELLQAEDRLINAIRNHDAKELEQILHPHYADAIQGHESAVTKRGVIARATAGRLPAYKIERERKLVRSGDSFTVEGLARDVAHELTEDHPTEEWASVSRIWSREGGRFIATAQTVTPMEEREAREKLSPETKEKKRD